MMELRGEFCRRCRDADDEGRVLVRADFILWGKLLPPEHLGPRCTPCAADHIGWAALHQIDQWAVYDLRPVNQVIIKERANG